MIRMYTDAVPRIVRKSYGVSLFIIVIAVVNEKPFIISNVYNGLVLVGERERERRKEREMKFKITYLNKTRPCV